MFSSQIPDLDLTTSDDTEAVVMIVSGGTSIFSATHIPFAKSITVHDIRSVIESDETLATCQMFNAEVCYGTGRETPRKPRAEGEFAHTSAEAQPGLRLRNPRGNSGDLGRAKRRQRCRWFSRKYYASVMRLKEFYEENVGRTFCGILSSALSKDFRQNH